MRVGLAAACIAFAAAQTLPDGEGKKILESQCASCHTLDPIVSRRLSAEAWKDVVVKMKSLGAALDDKSTTLVVDYLSKHFGAASETDKVAEKFIEGICASCHDSSLIRSTRATKQEWVEIVQNMNRKGAGLSEADVELLAAYLARNYK